MKLRFPVLVSAIILATSSFASAETIDPISIKEAEKVLEYSSPIEITVTESKQKAVNVDDNGNLTLLAPNMTFSSNYRAVQAYGSVGSEARLSLGSSTTEKITLNATKTDYNLVAGIFAHKGSDVSVEAKQVEINSDYGGVWVQNGTDKTDRPENATAVKIQATDSIEINAKTSGIINFSNGLVDLVSKHISITAPSVLDIRGHSITNINVDGSGSVVLNGNVFFETPGTPNGGEKIDAQVNIVLNNAQSSWTGNVVKGYPTVNEDASNPSDYTQPKGFNLTLANGATWNPTVIQEEIVGSNTVKKQALNNLTFNNGIINISTVNQQVEIEKLSGSGGTLNLAAAVESGKLKSAQVVLGELSQTKVRTTGPLFNVNYVGVNADTVTVEMVKTADAPISIANNSTVTLPGSTVNQTVTEGDIRGKLTIATTYDANGNVTDVSTSQTQNSKLDAFGSVSALSVMTLRHEMNSLSKRMGELRDAPTGVGAWARYYGSEMEYGAQNLTSKNNTIQIGSDYTVGDWKVGVAANYTDGESSYDNGSADNKNYGLAVYGTWFVPCGAYVDLIAKYSRMDNDFALNGMNGSYENNAFNVSAETGYRFEFMDGGLFVEPQVGVSYGRIMGDDFTAQNGVRVEQDEYDSLIGRVGVRTGFKFPKDKGLIYARVSGLYDFQGEMDSVASKDNLKETLTEDLGGAWLELGVGANFNWTDNTYSYIDIERTNGGDVKENYRFNVGIRHTF